MLHYLESEHLKVSVLLDGLKIEFLQIQLLKNFIIDLIIQSHLPNKKVRRPSPSPSSLSLTDHLILPSSSSLSLTSFCGICLLLCLAPGLQSLEFHFLFGFSTCPLFFLLLRLFFSNESRRNCKITKFIYLSIYDVTKKRTFILITRNQTSTIVPFIIGWFPRAC